MPLAEGVLMRTALFTPIAPRWALVIGLLLAAGTLLPPGARAQERGAPRWWRERLTLERPDASGNPVLAIALSPDGTVAITAHEGGTVRAWDARTGKDGAPPLAGHDRVAAIGFTRDGKMVLIADAK